MNCLTGDSVVQVKDKNGISRAMFFKEFDSYFDDNVDAQWVDVTNEGLKTLSKDKEYTPIQKILRRKHDDVIYNITTKDGYMLRATGDHILEVQDSNGKVVEKPVKKLVTGDEIPLATYPSDTFSGKCREINLIDNFKKDEKKKIYIANTEYVNENLPDDLRELIQLKVERYHSTSPHKTAFSLAEYCLLRKYVNLDERKLILTSRGHANYVPAVIPVNRTLGKFLGYIFTEGSIAEYDITFSNKNQEILEDFLKCIKELFPNVSIKKSINKNNVDIYHVNGRLLSSLFKGVLAYKQRSNDIHLNSWFRDCTRDFALGFISAMIDGDGYIQSDGYRVGINLTAKDVIMQLREMFTMLNIPTKYKHTETAGTQAVFNGKISVRNFDEYKLSITGKGLNRFRELIHDSRIVNSVSKKIGIERNHKYGQVVNITTEKFNGYVYDFETENHFFAADGLLVHNCCQIDIGKLFKNGFSTGHGYLREPNSIRAAAALSCVAVQANQNDEFGGQSVVSWDGGLAPYVHKSFKRHLSNAIYSTKKVLFPGRVDDDEKKTKKEIQKWIEDNDIRYGQKGEKQANVLCLIREYMTKGCPEANGNGWMPERSSTVYNIACKETEDETFQAMEAAIHNFNSLHSRAGAQVPFSSINYGIDTSPEGRLIIDKTLDAIWNGLGHGETPIFPISVFQIREGINYNEGDPNYDLFKKACKVSAKRLFPNFLNLDSSFNSPYFKEGDYNTYVATMGCRTRVMSNVNGPEESGRRGNFAFVTINLPMLALEASSRAKDQESKMKIFWDLFDEHIVLSRDYLKWRYEIIAKKKVKNFPFLMGQGVWMDSEKLGPEDEIRSVLKHASLSIGFCGLAECLVALVGKHHGESDKAQELGLKIVGHLREMTDKFTEEEHMNWTCFSSPAESTAGAFLRACRKKFGIVPGVTEHEYFTNSNHVPPYYKCNAYHKIQIEAPYHSKTNAGNISYVEIDGDPLKNLKAFEQIVRAMHDANMGYFSLNHAVDRDPVCGYTGLIENECPHCHRREDGRYHEKIKRPEK